MNLSVVTRSDFILLFEPPSEIISPSTSSALESAFKSFNDQDFRMFHDLMIHSELPSDPSITLKLFKHLLWALSESRSPQANLLDLKKIFDKIHEKTHRFFLKGIPIIHRIYYHIYLIAASQSLNIDDPQFGENHAFSSRARLQLALHNTCLELTEDLIKTEVNHLCQNQAILSGDIRWRKKALQYSSLFSAHLPYTLISPKTLNLTSQRVSQIPTKHFQVLSTERPITWLTGTSSFTLIGMEQSVLQGLLPDQGLIPTGLLLKQNIVPLAGELGDGISTRGINLKNLSGVTRQYFRNAFEYAKEKKFYFSPKKAFSNLTTRLKQLPRQKLKSYDELNALKIDLLRFFQFADVTLKQKMLIKTALSVWFKLICFRPDEDVKQSLWNLCERKKAALSPIASEILQTEAFPVVFASTSLKDEDLQHVASSIKGEAVYRGALLIEKDLQIAITDTEHVDILQKFWQGRRIHVLSFELAEIFIKLHFEDYEFNTLEDL